MRTVLFFSAMPPKDLAPFSYIPHKKPSLTIKYQLSTYCCWCVLSWVQLHRRTGSAITG